MLCCAVLDVGECLLQTLNRLTQTRLRWTSALRTLNVTLAHLLLSAVPPEWLEGTDFHFSHWPFVLNLQMVYCLLGKQSGMGMWSGHPVTQARATGCCVPSCQTVAPYSCQAKGRRMDCWFCGEPLPDLVVPLQPFRHPLLPQDLFLGASSLQLTCRKACEPASLLLVSFYLNCSSRL